VSKEFQDTTSDILVKETDFPLPWWIFVERLEFGAIEFTPIFNHSEFHFPHL
jgi:hypothetical protein